MHLGVPVVALATSEAGSAVPVEAGVASTDPAELKAGLRRFVHEPDLARIAGKAAREHAVTHFRLDAFLSSGEGLLAAVAR